jgi:hypothetical protein
MVLSNNPRAIFSQELTTPCSGVIIRTNGGSGISAAADRRLQYNQRENVYVSVEHSKSQTTTK